MGCFFANPTAFHFDLYPEEKCKQAWTLKLFLIKLFLYCFVQGIMYYDKQCFGDVVKQFNLSIC